MNEKSTLISRLIANKGDRVAYIKGKMAVFIPAQIRALRLRSNMPRQADLAKEADMQQSRISMFETPGAANFTIDTLARLAAVFKVGLLVKFVPFHKMLEEENEFSMDTFDMVRIDKDMNFLTPILPKNKDIPQEEIDKKGELTTALTSDTKGRVPNWKDYAFDPAASNRVLINSSISSPANNRISGQVGCSH